MRSGPDKLLWVTRVGEELGLTVFQDPGASGGAMQWQGSAMPQGSATLCHAACHAWEGVGIWSGSLALCLNLLGISLQVCHPVLCSH